MCNYSNTDIYITNLFINMIPKYQNNKNFTNKEVERWGNDWKWRLTPVSRSKVLTEWRYTGKKPKAETSEEYTKRRVKEIVDQSSKETKWMRKTADALHTVGTVASGVGLIGSTILNPVATIGALAGGITGSKGVDKAVQKYTGNNQTTWAQEFNRKLGLRENSIIGELSNPGIWIGGGIGSKGASLTKQGVDYLIRMDMPRYGYAPTTQYYFEPKYVGVNGVAIAGEKIVHPARGRNFNPIFESDLPELQKMVDNREYKIVNVPKVGEIKMYYPKGNKQPIREDELLKLLSDRNSSGLTSLPSRKEAAKIVKQIREQYAKIIEKNKRETGIDWSDQNFVMASMPDELKASTVGFDNKTPFLTRYYNNVLKVIGENGIQKRLLKSGELRKNHQRQWEGLVNGQYQRVDPTEYIKMRIANEKGLRLSLDPISPGATNYPMNGTKNRNYGYLRRPSSSPGQNGYWTGIQDELGNKSGMIEHYKGKGASVPFFRMPEYELPIMRPNGMSSSNSYGGSGQSLMDMLLRKPGNIQRPTYVSDPNGSGMPFNEYNFGPNVPNPKSMWNTLDFELGAGPLAYVPQNIEQNNLA